VGGVALLRAGLHQDFFLMYTQASLNCICPETSPENVEIFSVLYVFV
jgi:hypothetical protein